MKMVKDLIANRLPKIKFFSKLQTIIFMVSFPIWFLLYKKMALQDAEQGYPYIIYLLPFIYILFLGPYYVLCFIRNDDYRSALPYTGRVPVLNAILHSIFLSFTVFIFTDGGKFL